MARPARTSLINIRLSHRIRSDLKHIASSVARQITSNIRLDSVCHPRLPDPYLRTRTSQITIVRRLAKNGSAQKLMKNNTHRSITRALNTQSFDRHRQLSDGPAGRSLNTRVTVQISKTEVAQKDDDELTDG